MIFLRNLLRAPLRSLMTVLGIAAGVALFAAVSAITADLRQQIGAAIDAEKIRFVGCSNWTVPRIREAQAYAEKNDRPTFVISQVRWSLAKVNPESQKDPGLVEMDDNMRHYHRETGLAVAAYSSRSSRSPTR